MLRQYTYSMTRIERKIKMAAGAALVASLLVGCKGSTPPPSASSAPPPPAPKRAELKGPAGYPVKRDDMAPARLQGLELVAATKYGAPRANPFALTKAEMQFDRAQSSERLLSTAGWVQEFEVPVDKDKDIVYEQQPPRRLMGIVVGDAIYAVIDMGDNKGVIIHPGMVVPNTPWYVVSIDEEKAVLRRDGNVYPKEIVVRLQGASSLSGGGGTTTRGGSGAGSGTPGNKGGAGKGGGFGGAGDIG